MSIEAILDDVAAMGRAAGHSWRQGSRSLVRDTITLWSGATETPERLLLDAHNRSLRQHFAWYVRLARRERNKIIENHWSKDLNRYAHYRDCANVCWALWVMSEGVKPMAKQRNKYRPLDRTEIEEARKLHNRGATIVSLSWKYRVPYGHIYKALTEKPSPARPQQGARP